MSIASGPLRVHLVVPAEARMGANVTFVVRVENPATTPVDAYLRGRDITVDLVVRRADGSVAWRSLERSPIQSILQLRTFAAGEVVELRETWDQRGDGARLVGAGEYTVQATLMTEERPGPVSERMPLRIR